MPFSDTLSWFFAYPAVSKSNEVNKTALEPSDFFVNHKFLEESHAPSGRLAPYKPVTVLIIFQLPPPNHPVDSYA